ncbi:MAG TPA: hypothetical protein VFE86_11735 [Ilumatobacteraceae bacterium]|nr:hypothetical protein [Ilumatobacteraceae bacterium]
MPAAPSEPPPPVQAAAPPSSTEILAATIAGAVERQLTQYMSTMSQQIEATRQEADKARIEMRAEFAQQVEAMTARLDTTQQVNDRYQAALQAALEERLAEFANHQHQTLTTINSKLASLPSMVQAELPAQFAVVSQGLRDYLEHKTSAVEQQIDELHKSSRRFDEQAASIVSHINETVAALTRRMDDGDHGVTRALEHRLGDVRGLVDQAGADVARQLAEHGQILSQRVDTIDMKMVDRAIAMEERINDHNGVKIANLEATIGRVGAGFDDAMGALSKRLADLDARLLEAGDRMDGLAADVAKVDEEAINAVKEQLSSAVGEAMLVRIEVDRFIASQEEKFDATALRMSEIEAQLADTMDVSEAVQLERLEEIERALIELNPNQFVRKVDVGNGGGFSAPNSNPSLPTGSANSSSEPSYSSF